MLLPGSFSAALALMLVSMLCWGSWTNTSRLTRGWRLEYYYIDYAAGVFLAAFVAAIVGGAWFHSPEFLRNLHEADRAALVCSAVAGVTLNLGNFLLLAGIVRVGMTLAFPVSVGFALVVSTVASYAIRPLGDPWLLGSGVVLVFLAVMTNSLAYGSGSGQRAGGSRHGLAMCFAAGVLYSITGTLCAKALAPPRPVSPYGLTLLYGCGVLLTMIPLLLYLRWRPLDGIPLAVREYAAGSRRDHIAGLAGGAIWAAGLLTDILGAGYAGMAVAGAVGQANPLIAAIWGIFVWKEFSGAPRRTHFLLGLMIALYVAGLVLLALSFPH